MKTMNLLPRKIHINIAAAAAKSLQSCPTLCDPTDGSQQAPPSLGFSRQEHWSGLPFPSPLYPLGPPILSQMARFHSFYG